MKLLRVITACTAIVVAVPVLAETITIEPSLVTASDTVERALQLNKGRASTSIEGRGSRLNISYTASEPIDVFMVPLRSDKTYVPMDFMHFTLPKSEQGSVRIDLTVSPGWTPKETTYLLNLLTTSDNVNADFTDLSFEETSLLTVITAGLRHLFTVEPYTPSSYHALRGYRIFGISLTTVLGLVTVVMAGALFALTKTEKRLSRITTLLTIVTLLYGVRFSVDLLRFTHEHLVGYMDGIYDEAGSAHQIGRTITDISQQSTTPVRVTVCRDGTNYKEKIVRYVAYPIPVSEVSTGATLALVMDKNDWNTEMTIDARGSKRTLHCGSINQTAQKVTDFPDGSILFSLQ